MAIAWCYLSSERQLPIFGSVVRLSIASRTSSRRSSHQETAVIPIHDLRQRRRRSLREKHRHPQLIKITGKNIGHAITVTTLQHLHDERTRTVSTMRCPVPRATLCDLRRDVPFLPSRLLR